MQKAVHDIEKLYDTYSRKLYFTSLRITGNEFDAEEAVSDTFIKYYNTAPVINIEKIGAWLTKVCIHNSVDILRKRNKDELFFSQISDSQNRRLHNLSGENFENGENDTENIGYSVEAIKNAFKYLPDGYRLILSLYLFEGYDYTEISQITGLKESSVRSQYMRGKAKLTEIVKHFITNG